MHPLKASGTGRYVGMAPLFFQIKILGYSWPRCPYLFLFLCWIMLPWVIFMGYRYVMGLHSNRQSPIINSTLYAWATPQDWILVRKLIFKKLMWCLVVMYRLRMKMLWLNYLVFKRWQYMRNIWGCQVPNYVNSANFLPFYDLLWNLYSSECLKLKRSRTFESKILQLC